MNEKMFEVIKNNMNAKDSLLSKYACLNKEAFRVIDDKNDKFDIRPAFFRDVDRIIHASSYTRYLDKTQVFSFEENDNLSTRIVHVQLVSKIARTIGRALNLNEDLIEAVALGHDIGHTPFGHAGEAMLNKISIKYLGEMFNHNIQSVRQYLNVENNGVGLNLTIQTLDGIMCHNGEMISNIYYPVNKTKADFLNEYRLCYTDKNILKGVKPMTLEGCVVRISDVIGYLGRDIEDAINVGLIKRNDIPDSIKEVLGVTNKEIVNTIIMDIISNSYDQNYIKISEKVYNAISDLKEFNYKNIYYMANSGDKIKKIEEGMNFLFEKYLNDIKCGNRNSDIYKVFIINMSNEYLENTSDERVVLDYIAGMTDEYLLEKLDENKMEV